MYCNYVDERLSVMYSILSKNKRTICLNLIISGHIGNWSDYEAQMKEKFGKDLTPHRVKYRMLKR